MTKKLIKNFTLLKKSPQKRGVCLKLFTMSPKKPNSANRRVVRLKISNFFQNVVAKIPGEKHNLQQHSTVLVQGARVKDLIGVKLKTVRGKYDLSPVGGRKSSRSKYGVKL